jgi:cation diffusion facilitator CzcD-associated flavoprotein CzcO
MQPNVELVTEGIREVVPDGIVTQDGRKIELDTIVFATGFDVMNPPHFRHVVGRGGRSIREVWDEDGIRAYFGTVIPGFPNHFVLLGPNTASGNNSALQPIEAQIGFAIDALRAMDARGATAVDVRRDVMERFDDEIQRRLAPTVWNSGGCHSWYVGPDGRNFTIWPAFANEYKRRLARFDSAEFELTSAPAAVAMG